MAVSFRELVSMRHFTEVVSPRWAMPVLYMFVAEWFLRARRW